MPRTRRKPSRIVESSESRGAEVLTIAWMLTVVTALACEVLSVLLLLASRRWPQPYLELFSRLLLFAALVIGVISLLLLPAVLKTRRVPPPRGITVFAIVVALMPLLVYLLNRL